MCPMSRAYPKPSDASLAAPAAPALSIPLGEDAEQWIFHPIANARAHEAVVEQITFAIRAGGYGPGERLPPIDELSRTMRVSRPVIGEALKVLSAAGVLKVQRGINGGMTVLTTEIPPSVMALGSTTPHQSVHDIVEARRPVEMHLALLAGDRATASDFEMMEKSVTALRAHRRASLEKRIRYDHLFHYHIGRAARSRALALYQHQLLEQLFLRMAHYFDDIEDVDSVVALHQQTLDALRTRDRISIERAIHVHLLPLERAVAASPESGGAEGSITA